MRCHRADHWLASGADRALGAKYLVLLAPGLMRGGIVLSRSSVKTGDQTFYAKRFSQEAQRPGAERALSVLSSGLAVTKTIGVRLPFAISRLCRSTPLMPGIRTSVTRHSVSDKQPDSRNSSADAKVAVA